MTSKEFEELKRETLRVQDRLADMEKGVDGEHSPEEIETQRNLYNSLLVKLWCRGGTKDGEPTYRISVLGFSEKGVLFRIAGRVKPEGTARPRYPSVPECKRYAVGVTVEDAEGIRYQWVLRNIPAKTP